MVFSILQKEIHSLLLTNKGFKPLVKNDTRKNRGDLTKINISFNIITL